MTRGFVHPITVAANRNGALLQIGCSGVLVPNAPDLVTFNLSGPGRIVAVDSGDNTSHEPFQAQTRHAYEGQYVAILKANALSGRIEVTASAGALSSAVTAIEVGRPAEAK